MAQQAKIHVINERQLAALNVRLMRGWCAMPEGQRGKFIERAKSELASRFSVRYVESIPADRFAGALEAAEQIVDAAIAELHTSATPYRRPHRQLPLVDPAATVPAAARSQHVANDVEPGRQQLIPLAQHEIAGSTVQTVDARALHAFLEVGKVFGAWIKERIDQYGFSNEVDYLISETGIQVPHQGGTRRTTRIDYHLTLDTAKELAMVERNAKGREARRYFIECEKRLKEHEAGGGRQVAALPDFSNPAAAARAWAEQFEERQRLALENKAQAEALDEAAPKVDFHDTVADTSNCVTIEEAASASRACLRPAARTRRRLKKKRGTRWCRE
ncbi:antA/AntB antirepressor family protein [Rubrivivax benzoatilyticus]|uniref:antA/AntB antirepressor family protein n=1 Tax=Rubrivivax benzoatilyticus TaxID=316997 RepID=UPI00020A3F95|nr:antA/AntB antirepressor family protein [Rubrivivax benzoatilyticus]EGJ11970.1 putative antirepressor [Rubrivivax benzoatilyticus JA2 = ATCC BAA-35]